MKNNTWKRKRNEYRQDVLLWHLPNCLPGNWLVAYDEVHCINTFHLVVCQLTYVLSLLQLVVRKSGARAVDVLYVHVTQCHIIVNHLLLGPFLNSQSQLLSPLNRSKCKGGRYETLLSGAQLSFKWLTSGYRHSSTHSSCTTVTHFYTVHCINYMLNGQKPYVSFR